MIGVPSIDQAAFLVAPLAQELTNYAKAFSDLHYNDTKKRIHVQCLTFNFTQQPTQMIPEYLNIQGKYLASVINYIRKELIPQDLLTNHKFIFVSHWSGNLVTYRALQILYDSGEYKIDDFY